MKTSKFLRVSIVGVIAAAAAFGGVARAVETPLPTEFESGGVRWGDLENSGFYNDGGICLEGGKGFNMGEAYLIATEQGDAFDDAGLVNVDGSYFTVPGALNGPVDLTDATLQTPAAATGPVAPQPLDVSVQWQGAGPGTIRELVSLTNTGASDFEQEIVIETNLGSDGMTTLQASSTGDISGYPTNARWFATSQGDTDPTGDPTIVSVATGPGTVQSPGTIAECPVDPGPTAATKKADSAETPPTDVVATGTPLDTDDFTYRYNVTIPAGQTRYLMVFWSLHETIAEAVAAGPAWDTYPTAGSDALAGITPEQLPLIVNWAPALEPAPLPIEPALRFTG